jgi:hypothetical protein
LLPSYIPFRTLGAEHLLDISGCLLFLNLPSNIKKFPCPENAVRLRRLALQPKLPGTMNQLGKTVQQFTDPMFFPNISIDLSLLSFSTFLG